MSRILIALLLILPICVSATTIDRGTGAGSASRVLNEAKDQGLPHDLNEWSDIEAWPHEMQGDFLGSYSESYNNFTDTHSILPSSKRAIDKGRTLIAIEATAWNKSKFHRDVSIERSLIPHLFFWMYNVDKFGDKYERSYLGINNEGTYFSGRMPEDEFQKIKQIYAINLPKPKSYRFNISQIQPNYLPSPIIIKESPKRNYGFELLTFILVVITLKIVITKFRNVKKRKVTQRLEQTAVRN